VDFLWTKSRLAAAWNSQVHCLVQMHSNQHGLKTKSIFNNTS
jgi:hypothetical protein